jgi:hypothetical protein
MIRISHARAEDVGAMGVEAGKGEQKVRQQAQRLEADLQAQSNAARIDAAKINADTAINMAVMDANNNREMAQFESFMRSESQRRQIAWETEKIELGQRHDFDLNMQRKDLENSMIMEKEARDKAELDQSKDALKKARENFEISEDDFNRENLNLDMGGRPGATLNKEATLEGMSQKQTYKAELDREKAASKRAEPENVAMRTADLITQVVAESKNMDAETKAEIQKLIKTPNISEAAVQRMLNDIRETQAAITKRNTTYRMAGPDYGSMGAFAK